MSEHRSEQAQIEEFAKQFELTKPSRVMRQAVLDSAHSAWSSQAETKADRDSLVPYFAALAATLLMILTVNALGKYTVLARRSEYVVTIRPSKALHLDDETHGKRPYQHSMALCIVGVNKTRHMTHVSQLQAWLSQGASL